MEHVPLLPSLRGAFKGPIGCFHWQWRWQDVLRLWPFFDTHLDVMDYGMPEYAAQYPTYHVNVFSFSGFQAMWYSNLDK